MNLFNYSMMAFNLGTLLFMFYQVRINKIVYQRLNTQSKHLLENMEQILLFATEVREIVTGKEGEKNGKSDNFDC